MKKQGLIKLTKSGLYCERGDFYIDPWLPVKRAILTHAHADHTYRGNQDYLVPEEGARLSRIRLGDEARISTQKYGAVTDINGVKISFHPAGHVLGSAQVRVEYKGEIWVVSGDYKLMLSMRPPRSSNRSNVIISLPKRRSVCRFTAGQPTEFIIRADQRLVARQSGKRKSFGDFRVFARKIAAHYERRRPFNRKDFHARRGRASDAGLPRIRRRSAADEIRRRS
jgi:hypothetical protein